jgi:hypothetical protein
LNAFTTLASGSSAAIDRARGAQGGVEPGAVGLERVGQVDDDLARGDGRDLPRDVRDGGVRHGEHDDVGARDRLARRRCRRPPAPSATDSVRSGVLAREDDVVAGPDRPAPIALPTLPVPMIMRWWSLVKPPRGAGRCLTFCWRQARLPLSEEA